MIAGKLTGERLLHNSSLRRESAKHWDVMVRFTHVGDVGDDHLEADQSEEGN